MSLAVPREKEAVFLERSLETSPPDYCCTVYPVNQDTCCSVFTCAH